ncbi:TraB/GumN family protein [Rhodanobacter sp. MP7CTX1]|jgi:pheromone shutdown-related protein TraB|uniref:TraB/GumN family protein n=1 Tax=Rhodanobacter sp. MP7CTX1 TaxID=2723084 RepID=UPI0016197464|nr:TraB/GumN family protein [Rhodanobacter sp. MP7CTX1]MBB6186990.1 pheromone shutdown-related protein TraB [Rhodanobacter sp. MP7CTX1]
MSFPETNVALLPALQGQPIERVQRDGVEYVVLGTAHVSRSSVEAVDALLANEHFDAVAVELCDSRAQSMRDPEAFKQMDLFKVIRQGKAGMVAASLVLSTFQKRLADQSGIQPGAEMKAAMDGAEQRGLPLWLIDREVGTTLKRAWHSVGFWQRFGLLGGLLASVFEREEIEQAEIEKLKQGDLLESAFSEFASESKPLYQSLIGERDAFMAARLREEATRSATSEPRRVLVVIGAGHLKGLCTLLRDQQSDPATEVEKLGATPPKARWPKWVAGALVLLVFAAIAFAFHRNAALGTQALLSWVLFTGGFAALGALAAGGHPLSIVAAFIAAPIKPFRPGIPAGGISAMAEAWVRRPRVADFETLRDDIVHWSGWWKNRVARTLLNFFLVSIGTIIGEYTAGIHIFKSLI